MPQQLRSLRRSDADDEGSDDDWLTPQPGGKSGIDAEGSLPSQMATETDIADLKRHLCTLQDEHERMQDTVASLKAEKESLQGKLSEWQVWWSEQNHVAEEDIKFSKRFTPHPQSFTKKEKLLDQEKKRVDQEKVRVDQEKVRVDQEKESLQAEKKVLEQAKNLAAASFKNSFLSIQFQGEDGSWKLYPAECIPDIMQSLIKGEKQYRVCIDDRRYIIHFEDRYQQNLASGRTRKIRMWANLPENWSLAKELDLSKVVSTYKNPTFNNIAVRLGGQGEHAAFEAVLKRSIFHHQDLQPQSLSPCDRFRKSLKVTGVTRIENAYLYNKYAAFRSEMEERHRAHDVMQTEIVPQISSHMTKLADELLDRNVRSSVNEVLLCHGTSNESAHTIAVEGFDFRLARPGYYGTGTYFSSQTCKCRQYCDQSLTMIISRVALGTPHYADEVNNKVTRPPKCTSTGHLFDSIIAKPGKMKNHVNGIQSHQEFVIFEKFQAYPEFLVTFTATL
mmetsp:Transcript_106302/g.189026  ORF Transcript_106302/g.189026 Transcript_106302/m.189026 type:complete len:504 (-) Transcript_106302:33-1544(-)